jgi:rubrerythrin
MTQPMDFFAASAAVARSKTMDVPTMELVFRLENSGEDFYNALADRVDNEEAAELLRRNGREELGHARRIRRAITLKLGTEWEPSEEAMTRFAIPLPDEISVDVFPAIVKAEVDGDAGYQRWADNEPDPEIARLLRLNGREETIHGERVAKALEILQAAQS